MTNPSYRFSSNDFTSRSSISHSTSEIPDNDYKGNTNSFISSLASRTLTATSRTLSSIKGAISQTGAFSPRQIRGLFESSPLNSPKSSHSNILTAPCSPLKCHILSSPLSPQANSVHSDILSPILSPQAHPGVNPEGSLNPIQLSGNERQESHLHFSSRPSIYRERTVAPPISEIQRYRHFDSPNNDTTPSMCPLAYEKAIEKAMFDISNDKQVGLLARLPKAVTMSMPFHKDKSPPASKPPVLQEELQLPSKQKNLYHNNVDWGANDIIAIGYDNKVLIIPQKKKGTVITLPQLEGPDVPDIVTCVKWLKQANLLAIGTERGLVHILDINKDNWHGVMDVRRHGQVVTLFVDPTNPNALWVNSCLEYQSMFSAFDIQNPCYLLDERSGENDTFINQQFSPGQSRLIIGYDNGATVFLDGNDIMNIPTNNDASVKAIAWHATKGMAAIGADTRDRSIRIWDINNKRLMAEVKTDAEVTSLHWVGNFLFSTSGHDNYNTDVLSAESSYLTCWLFDCERQSIIQLHSTKVHEGRTLYTALSPDNSTIITMGEDGKVKWWNITPSVSMPIKYPFGSQVKSDKTIR